MLHVGMYIHVQMYMQDLRCLYMYMCKVRMYTLVRTCKLVVSYMLICTRTLAMTYIRTYVHTLVWLLCMVCPSVITPPSLSSISPHSSPSYSSILLLLSAHLISGEGVELTPLPNCLHTFYSPSKKHAPPPHLHTLISTHLLHTSTH